MNNRTVRLDTDACVDARKRKGLSRERLAERSRGGLSVATLKRLERGDAVYLDTARRLAELLEVPLADLARAALDVPDPRDLAGHPAIAVLPFEVIGGDPGGRFFADGLVEDLLTRLGQRWFPIIARSSSFKYTTPPEPSTVRAELGAHYVIEGSLRRDGGQIRLTARLTETATAQQLWACTYERPVAGVFELQDELASAIVGQVDSVLLEAAVRRQAGRDPSDLSAWELSLQGSFAFHTRTGSGNTKARTLFEQALRREPMIPLAWFQLVMTHQRDVVNQWSSDAAGSVRAMAATCAEFARHCPTDPRLQVASAFADVYLGERRQAMGRLREAIALDPNATSAYSLYGQTLAMANEPDEAIEQFEVAMRLSPRDAELWSLHTSVALCHFVAGRYAEMLEWADRAVLTRPELPFPYGTVAVAHASLGHDAEARAAVAEMLTIAPNTSARGVEPILRSTNPEIGERYVAALRRAGLPA